MLWYEPNIYTSADAWQEAQCADNKGTLQKGESGTTPLAPEETIRLMRTWVNGNSNYFGTGLCRIEQVDGPISTILVEAGELELLAVVRRFAPQR